MLQRLFIAAVLTNSQTNELQKLQNDIKSLSTKASLTRPENLHLTLAFIGEYADPDYVLDVIDRVPGLGARHAGLRQEMVDRRRAATAYAEEWGTDLPEIADWVWPDAGDAVGRVAGGGSTGGDNE